MSLGNPIFGPASFYNMKAIQKVGAFDKKLFHWMDYDMYLRILKIMPFQYVDTDISTFRIVSNQKSPFTLSNTKAYKRFHKEAYEVWRKNGSSIAIRLWLKKNVLIGYLSQLVRKFSNNEHEIILSEVRDYIYSNSKL